VVDLVVAPALALGALPALDGSARVLEQERGVVLP
jgi:hypothetical protein